MVHYWVLYRSADPLIYNCFFQTSVALDMLHGGIVTALADVQIEGPRKESERMHIMILLAWELQASTMQIARCCVSVKRAVDPCNTFCGTHQLHTHTQIASRTQVKVFLPRRDRRFSAERGACKKQQIHRGSGTRRWINLFVSQNSSCQLFWHHFKSVN